MIDYLLDHVVAIGVTLVVLFCTLVPAAYIVALRSSHEVVTFKVTGKVYHAGSGSSDGKYLVFTNKGTFADEDSVTYFKFNSSDLYGQLRVGKTYTCSAAGWRIPILSSYVNLMSCKVAR